MIRVFVIAPTPIAQTGIHAILSSEEIQVVGMSARPEAFTASMPGVDVVVIADELQLEEAGRVLTQAGKVALVVLTDNDERILPLIRRLTLSGWGLVPLDAPPEQLRAAVIVAAQNMVTLPAASANRLYEVPMRRTEVVELEESEEPLTPREQEVLELVSQGLSNKLIARRLTISEHTVKFHLSSLSTKLGASSRTDAVRKGLRRGLITV